LKHFAFSGLFIPEQILDVFLCEAKSQNESTTLKLSTTKRFSIQIGHISVRAGDLNGKFFDQNLPIKTMSMDSLEGYPLFFELYKKNIM